MNQKLIAKNRAWSPFTRVATLLPAALGMLAFAQESLALMPWNQPAPTYRFTSCRQYSLDIPEAAALMRITDGSMILPQLREQLAALGAKPVVALSAEEAETYLALFARALRALAIHYRDENPEDIAVAARNHARAIDERFRQEGTVHCAWLGVEMQLLRDYSLGRRYGYGAQEIEAAVAAYAAFLDQALANRQRLPIAASRLRDSLGHAYLDLGFMASKRNAPQQAGDLFEKGTRQLLDGAASSEHGAELERYAKAISTLPQDQQLRILRRVLTHVEAGWAAKPDLTETEMCAYQDIVSNLAEVELKATNKREALALFRKNADLSRRLRQADRENQNYESNQAWALLGLAEAYAVNGDRSAAQEQYRNARNAYDSASRDVKDTLAFSEFQQALAESMQRNLK